MADDEKKYSEDEMQAMLDDQEFQQGTKQRLETIDTSILRMDGKFASILLAVESGATDRRINETAFRTEVYSKFVKKEDLRLYAIGIITVVTLTTGVIQYIGSHNLNAQISSQIETLISDREEEKKVGRE